MKYNGWRSRNEKINTAIVPAEEKVWDKFILEQQFYSYQ
jgi:hypothetical protein